MTDLIVRTCEALIPIGPGEFGNQCPAVCEKLATEQTCDGFWYCMEHYAQMEIEGGEGVWVYCSKCEHCGGEHGKVRSRFLH
jgi:hypothetical protein